MLKRNVAKVSIFLLLVMLISLFAVGCKKEGGVFDVPEAYVGTTKYTVTNNIPSTTSGVTHPKVQIEMKDGGKMVFELYPEYAPETVNNFIELVEKKFYDGLTFHRIDKDFVIQGGDPNGDGSGSSGKTIKGEFAENGFTQNILKHEKGVISMARGNDPDSASCQFFIVDATTPTVTKSLDGKYAAFGKLIEGEEVLDKISETPVMRDPYNPNVAKPKKEVKIKKITVLEK